MVLASTVLLAAGPALAAMRGPAGRSLLPLDVHWSLQLDAAPLFPPAYDEEGAYVILRTGRLVAVLLEDGCVRWSVDVVAAEAPTAGQGLVYLATDGAIVALDAEDGSLRWHVPVEVPVAAPLEWDTGWLLAGLETGELLAIHGETGEELWRQALGAPLGAPVSLASNSVYAPLADGRVVALDLQTGEPLWEQRLGDRASDVLALDDRLFVGSGDRFLYSLALSDGEVLWRWRTGGDIVGAPVVDEDRVYFLSLDNVLRALDRRTGNQQWKRPMATRPVAGPLRIGSALLVSGLVREIRIFRTEDGEPGGEYVAPADLAAAPHWTVDSRTGDALLVVTGQGTLHRIGRGLGPPLVPLDYLPGWPEPPPLVPLESLPGTVQPVIEPSPADPDDIRAFGGPGQHVVRLNVS